MTYFVLHKPILPMRNLLHYFTVVCIIVLSFLCYSSNFYALLGSDDAVQVLMIHDFHLPHDLYFWGQDRYGSLIPLLGQFFYKVLQISPLTSESFAHYLLLIAGYFAFTSLFKSPFNKLILAIAWFFPPFRMVDLLRLNIGLEYSLLAISIFLLNKLYNNESLNYRLKQHFFLLSITLIFILAVWVSDLAVISIFLILMLQALFASKSNHLPIRRSVRWKPEIYYLLTGIIVGMAFILYGKYFADKSPSYDSFNNFEAIAASFGMFGGSIVALLTFRALEPFTSAYLYLVIPVCIILCFLYQKIQFTANARKWFVFFLIDCVLIFLVIMLSKWSFLNGVPRRYFISNYIVFWLGLLLAIEYLKKAGIKKALQVVLLISVMVSGIGSLYNLKYIWPKTLHSGAGHAREFESLGEIGIIANYWNSYLNAVTNPDQIVATPNDQSCVRNREMANEVLKRDLIYVVRDGWFEIFPDSMNQFGIPLYRDGTEFRLGNSFVCKYRKQTGRSIR